MQAKNKIRLLLLGIVVLLFASYRFAISNTLSLKKEHSTLKQEMDSFRNFDAELMHLTQKEIFIGFRTDQTKS